MSYFLKKAAKLESGSKTPGRDSAGSVTKAQVKEIAEKKMKDLNCDTIEAAMRMVEGSARSMGIEVEGVIAMAISENGHRTLREGVDRDKPIRSTKR